MSHKHKNVNSLQLETCSCHQQRNNSECSFIKLVPNGCNVHYCFFRWEPPQASTLTMRLMSIYYVLLGKRVYRQTTLSGTDSFHLLWNHQQLGKFEKWLTMLIFTHIFSTIIITFYGFVNITNLNKMLGSLLKKNNLKFVT